MEAPLPVVITAPVIPSSSGLVRFPPGRSRRFQRRRGERYFYNNHSQRGKKVAHVGTLASTLVLVLIIMTSVVAASN